MKVGAAWFRSAYLRRGSAGERPPNKGVAWPTARHSKGTGSGSGSGTGMRSEGEIPCEISRGITEAAHPARPRLVGEETKSIVPLQRQRKNSAVVSESAFGVSENATFSGRYDPLLPRRRRRSRREHVCMCAMMCARGAERMTNDVRV